MISFLFARHAVFGMIAAMTSARKDARMSISTPVASIVPPYLEERLGDAAAAIDTGDMGKLRTAADCYVTVLQSPSQFERHGLSESDQVELQNDPYVVSSWEVMLDQLTVHREFERALSLAIQTMPKHRQPHGDTALVTLASGRCPPLVETLSEKAPIRTIQEIRDAFEATSVDTTRFRVLSGMYDRAVKIYFNRNPKNAFAMLRKAISSTSPDGLAVQAAQTLSSVPLYIDDTPALTIAQVRSRARRLKRQHGLELLIVDYLQLLQGSGGRQSEGNRVLEISEITRGLKAIAKELNIPVIGVHSGERAIESDIS